MRQKANLSRRRLQVFEILGRSDPGDLHAGGLRKDFVNDSEATDARKYQPCAGFDFFFGRKWETGGVVLCRIFYPWSESLNNGGLLRLLGQHRRNQKPEA